MTRSISQVRLHPVPVSAGLLLLVAAIRAWLQWVGPLPGDRYASVRFGSPWTEAEVVRRITALFSALGTPLVAIALGGAGLLLLWLRTDPRATRGFVVACLVVPLNALLKVISGPTPLWSHTHPGGLNFPSGHVAFVTSVVGYLGWVAACRRQTVAALLALLAVVGMGPARVLAGAHLVSDVSAGYLVGAAVLVLAVAAAGEP